MYPSPAREAAPRRRPSRPYGWAICALLATQSAHGLHLQRDDAEYSNGVFHVRFEAVLDAPVSGIAAVLTDFARFAELDPRIHSAEVLGRYANGDVLMRTMIDACAGPFCRSVERVERVDSTPGTLIATVVPERSDLRHGVARTYWEEAGTCTRLRYEADFEPAFWVPDFVGTHLAAAALRDSTLRMFETVERLAHGR